MKIYVSHKRTGNDSELYDALRKLDAEFIFPHEKSHEAYNSKELFMSKGCDLVVAEVSEPATGVGIELGWASAYGISIVCVYKTGSSLSNSLKEVTQALIEYSDLIDLNEKLRSYLRR